MPAHPGTRRERHEPEWFRRRGVDDLPDVYVWVVRKHREFVDQRDIDVTKCVLEQLREFGLSGRSDRNCLVDELVVERLNVRERAGPHAGNDLGGVDETPARVAGVDTFWRIAEREVGIGEAS